MTRAVHMKEIDDIVSEMLNQASQIIGADWPKIQNHARAEFELLARQFFEIKKQQAAGALTQSQAEKLTEMVRNAAICHLLALQGMTKITVEKAINAALEVLYKALDIPPET